MTINNIPRDPLFHIFEYLEDEDKVRATHTCKLWQDVMNKKHWKPLAASCGLPPHDNAFETVKEHYHQHYNFKTLDDYYKKFLKTSVNILIRTVQIYAFTSLTFFTLDIIRMIRNIPEQEIPLILHIKTMVSHLLFLLGTIVIIVEISKPIFKAIHTHYFKGVDMNSVEKKATDYKTMRDAIKI